LLAKSILSHASARTDWQSARVEPLNPTELPPVSGSLLTQRL